jgi:hypothetical protein
MDDVTEIVIVVVVGGNLKQTFESSSLFPAIKVKNGEKQNYILDCARTTTIFQ